MERLSACDVVILCGGLGNRLRPETGETPKVLAAVNGIPFLDILLENLSSQGFRRVVLCTGYKAKDVEARYQKGFADLTIAFSREEEPLGTGGAIKNARAFVHSPVFFALNGDCYCALKYADLLSFHQGKRALASLVLSAPRDKKDFGAVVLGPSNEIVSFQEKADLAESPYVSVGIYCFQKEIFEAMPLGAKAFSIEQDFFPRIVGRGFYGFVTPHEFLDIGTPQRYQLAQKELKNRSRP